MAQAFVQNLLHNFPIELAGFFDDPPLVGEETLEGFIRYFSAIAADLNPVGAINWIYTRDAAYLSWQIRREQKVLVDVVKSFQVEIVRERLKASCDASDDLEADHYRIFGASGEVQRWANDPVARAEINAKLTGRGHSPAAILAQAYMRGAREIDAIEKRIASYEFRRAVLVREVERREEKFGRNLGLAMSSAIDGEFSEAAE
jgi:hypothetical protein